MDDFAHTHTRTVTRIYIKADLKKHLSYSEVPSFEKLSEWTIFGSFILFNLGKRSNFLLRASILYQSSPVLSPVCK